MFIFHEFKGSLADALFIQSVMGKDFMGVSMNHVLIGDADNAYRNRISESVSTTIAPKPPN